MGERNIYRDFYSAASWQGHFSYVVFSVHAVNPELLSNFLGFNPGRILFANMLYGNAVYIYSRPAMQKLRINYRALFSIYGSLMFNFSSLLMYTALYNTLAEKRILISILGFFAGKFMYSTFYSYLYFVDVCANRQSRRNSVLDHMFEEPL